MLRAIIFDFNGIIVNDEPIHLEMLQKVLKEEGISLSSEDYYARYLGFDDRGCFKAAFQERGRMLDETRLGELIRRKAIYYQEAMEKGLTAFPGVDTLIRALSSRFPLAIASGALRSEIESILAAMSLKKFFQAIVSAEDVKDGKPEPEIFTTALARLNETIAQSEPLGPSECLVIEDSREGVRGARRAGMKCLAVTNSHPAAELAEADIVLNSLDGIEVEFLESLFR